MRNKKLIPIIVFLFLLIVIMQYSIGQPSGGDILSNESETKTPQAAEYLNTSGGTFTTIILSSETQNLKWKAYAGNVSGTLVLDDASDYSIYQWQLGTFTGEVYATRNDSISWGDIDCADGTDISNEETAMNHTSSSEDSISNTFSISTHREFYVGSVKIDESTCPSTFTWVNDTQQTPSIDAPFQEVLLHDGTNLVYTTFIDDNTQGFNYDNYDFQMIVAEKGVGSLPATDYYFYLELQ